MKTELSNKPNANELLLDAIERCSTWLELTDLVRLSGVSAPKCKIALPQLLEAGLIGIKHQTTLRSSNEVAFYAKASLAKQEALTRHNSEDIRFAKSRFAGGKINERQYQPDRQDLQSLAMLVRKG